MTTMTMNNEKTGIEIRFDARPIQGTLDLLKSNGFRWHSQKKLWYAKKTPERLELAQRIITFEGYAAEIRAEEPAALAFFFVLFVSVPSHAQLPQPAVCNADAGAPTHPRRPCHLAP